MNQKSERLIFALGEIDEKYVKESEGKMKKSLIIKTAVSFVIVLALGVYLFLPFAPVTSDISEYASSEYFPLIEKIEAYNLSFKQPKYKNNFQYLGASLDNILGLLSKGDIDLMPPPNDDMAESDANGSYVESTDNQVAGVIESDLMKMTDRYIFRIGYRVEKIDKNRGQTVNVIQVYSIEKENSELVAEFDIPLFENQEYSNSLEMYLSADCNTITVVNEYRDNTGKNVGIISLDVSDVNNITERGRVSIDGSLNTSRMVGGKLLLVADYSFYRSNIDYSDPETFVPKIDSGNGPEPIEFEDIIYPDEVGSTNYSVVALLDVEDLKLLGANALLNFISDVYISENNIFITHVYTKKTESNDGQDTYTSSIMSDIAVLNYSGESLERRGVITVRGQAEDQYSFDEKDGYLRVVTSTSDGKVKVNGLNESFITDSQNVSLYIFDLTNNSLAYKVEDFAIEGEEATAVRFDGDKLYVCTAVVVKFTDPVYFFDLSDYENIGSVDTGVIEGYSDHLLNYGEGFVLGIGMENWQYNKVEIYEDRGDGVVSTYEYKFQGEYSQNYKAYLVNRENNLFGFGVNTFYEEDEQNGTHRFYECYVLIRFDQSEMVVKTFEINDLDSVTVRAAYIDGYLYITTGYDLTVEKIN